jgi:hypothetical protein
VMTSQAILNRLLVASTVFSVVIAGGCNRTPASRMQDVMRRTYDCNGKRLAVLYGRFMNRPLDKFPGPQGFTGPSNEQELKDFLVSMDDEVLAEFGVGQSELDGLFVVEKTQEPLVVRYGIKGDLSTRYPVVFERFADGATMRVFMTDGDSVMVPAAEMENYRSGQKDVKQSVDGAGIPFTDPIP